MRIDPTKDRINVYVGLFTTLIALAVYFRTLACSTSFWDCGEFVASSVCFGIPHPPGSAVFVLIGRVFSLLPFSSDFAYRVNMISALSSAAVVFVSYLVISKIILRWSDQTGDSRTRIGAYLGGFVGALCMAFSRTGWTNAVEAEVYGLTSLFSMLVLYLILVWYSDRESPKSDRLLILATYFSVLGVGVHMSAFLVTPAAFVFVLLVDDALRKDIKFWLAIISILLIMMDIKLFLISSLIWFVISVIGLFSSKQSRSWRLSAAMMFFAILAFTVQLYAPIRSSFDPPIDMNNPETWRAFMSFVEREQYGQENMVIRMFTRRAELGNQFGDFPRMGFWRFFSEQYSKPGPIFLLLFLVGMYGIYEAIRRKPKFGVLVLLLVLIGTVGMTFYMNFADGTKVDPDTMARRLEVRDRDYFWTPGFAFFGWCIGLGVAGIYGAVRRKLKGIAGYSPVVLALVPVFAIGHNFRACDRSLDTEPYDYAHNMLESCNKNSIMFTAGDNDTYPLWALQFGLGIRQDVHVINLSLLDVDWYILQKQTELRNTLGNLITLDTAQIQAYDTLINGLPLALPRKAFYDPLRKEARRLHPFRDRDGTIVRVNHQIIENILLNNIDEDRSWKHDIYFANPPPSAVAYDLNAHSEVNGLVYHVTRDVKNRAINVDEGFRLVDSVYHYRNLDNPKYYRDETGTSMAVAAGQKFFDLYKDLLAAGDTTRAVTVLEFMETEIPEYWEPPIQRPKLDEALGIKTQPDSVYKMEYLDFVNQLIHYAPDSYYYHQFKGLILDDMGRTEESIAQFVEAFEIMPASSLTYRSLVAAYVQAGKYSEAVAVSRRYLKLNPYDETARRIVDAYMVKP